MYKTILVTLEVTPTDRAIIDHVKRLAKLMHSSVVLLHVATGVPAKWYGQDAAGEEVEGDQAYLDQVKAEFEAAGVSAGAELAYGDPADEIVKWVHANGCDLVAMSTHGHGFVKDVLLGSVANNVRHRTDVPVLLVRASKPHGA
jgi:nucleotide-binding universal stress UspA family protein